MRCWAFVVFAACTCTTSIIAQDAPKDSGAAVSPVQQNAWISAGIGGGGAGGNGIAGVVSGWYAYGPYVVGARASSGGPLFGGRQVREKAALVGLRARSARTFALIGVGGGTMNGWRSNGEQSGTRTTYGDEPSIAFAAEAGVTYYAIGIGLDVFGASNHRTSYAGIALAVQLGYLK
jgi:hypothetical protein